jgi:hypothetical protein
MAARTSTAPRRPNNPGERFRVPGLRFVRSGRTYEQDGVNSES